MKNLTLRYSVTQFMFWAASTGAASFSTAYLLNTGLDAGTVGILVAAAGLLCCLTQPLLAGWADRAKGFVLIRLLMGISGVYVASFAVQLFSGVPMWLKGLCYMIGMWSSDVMVPLLNACSVAYQQAGYDINYGMARGIGSGASAMISLVLGYVIASFGSQWMIVLLIGFRLLSMVLLLGYPKIGKAKISSSAEPAGCSIGAFFRKYRWYCTSLLGILFLGMFHSMTENYLIAIVQEFGGTSAHVGTALFIASLVGAPVIMGFGFLRRRIREHTLLRIAALTFLLKSVLFYFASGIGMIYGIQLLQITSYGLLAPLQVVYAGEKVRPADMVKGQAFVTAAYSLGCSAGNFLGGQLLLFGVDVLLGTGIGMTVLGTVILFLTVDKYDQGM